MISKAEATATLKHRYTLEIIANRKHAAGFDYLAPMDCLDGISLASFEDETGLTEREYIQNGILTASEIEAIHFEA